MGLLSNGHLYLWNLQSLENISLARSRKNRRCQIRRSPHAVASTLPQSQPERLGEWLAGNGSTGHERPAGGADRAPRRTPAGRAPALSPRRRPPRGAAPSPSPPPPLSPASSPPP